jgi:modulator of FtsH protease
LEGWSNFFLGELSAAAALAGLLFVAVSVNQARILELGRIADRGIEALAMLFLVLVVASIPLMPGQPARHIGAEILLIAGGTLLMLVPVQRAYHQAVDPEYRRRSGQMAWLNRIAMMSIALGGLVTLWRGDGGGLYLVAIGILATFLAVGANAWVLPIEINR